jgi:hypothetical protein
MKLPAESRHTMKTEDKWKAALLSSSFPLETVVAKMLSARHFAILTDYAFATQLKRDARDWSVDIRAVSYLPFVRNRPPNADIELLVECKYRAPGCTWLFFEDPNPGGFSMVSHGATLRCVDSLSISKVAENATVSFDHTVKFALKVMEVSSDGVGPPRVDDAEARHGMLQLQYAIPRLIQEYVTANLEEFSRFKGDALPLFFMPILVTNADLRLVRGTLTTERVVKAKTIAEFGDQISRCVVYVDPSPEYRSHWVESLSVLKSVLNEDAIGRLDSARQRHFNEDGISGTVAIIKAMLAGGRSSLKRLSSQVLVCNVDAFDRTVAEILRAVGSALKSTKRIQEWKHDRFLPSLPYDAPLRSPAQVKLLIREGAL